MPCFDLSKLNGRFINSDCTVARSAVLTIALHYAHDIELIKVYKCIIAEKENEVLRVFFQM